MDDPNPGPEINKYRKFRKVDGATYHRVNQFLRKRTYITAREWALARLCTDFRTSGGAEMTFIGRHLPELVPFMEETYTPQAVNQARNAFKKKVRKSSATFFYGAMCGFFTTDELDDLLFEASEVARFLLEVEGTTVDIDEEIDIEDRITRVMRGVGVAAKTLLKTRGEDIQNPPEGANHPAVASGQGTPGQEPPGTGRAESRIIPGTPAPSGQGITEPPPAPVLNGDPHDGPPVPGAVPPAPAKGEPPGSDQPSPGHGDTKERSSSRNGVPGQEKEDA
ncbi:MAG TPA: DUF5806 family protein [Methanoregula sp.]|nr:DUF5806 family protein [Methanoregula sp.]